MDTEDRADRETAELLAGVVRADASAGSGVTLSGRCGACGYPLDGPPGVGHDIACGSSA